jgi:hypothetical protein
MNVTYGKSWFRAKKRLTEPWEESHARLHHDQRRLYVAVVVEDSSPTRFIEFSNTYVGVGFLDRFLREYLSYAFREIEPGRLFLGMATYRQFDGPSDKVARGETYFFQQDGSLKVERQDFLANELDVGQSHVDVSSNWEAYPAFGEYESITREQR